MSLNKIELVNFRNYTALKLDFSDKINFIYGDNAQGKTNLIEAIYYALAFRSFRTISNQSVIKYGTDSAVLKAEFSYNQILHDVLINIETSGKNVFIDSKKLTKTSRMKYGLFPALFSGEVIYCFKNFPKAKRLFFDRFLRYYAPDYMFVYQEYRNIIKQKNSILKQGVNYQALNAWNELLAQKATLIIQYRKKFNQRLNELLSLATKDIFVSAINFEIKYNPDIAVSNINDSEQTQKKIYEFLFQKRKQEIKRKQSLFGPHLDRYQINSGPQKTLSLSNGEYKLAFYLVQFVLAEYLRKHKLAQIVFLMDDLYSELDQKSRAKVLDYLRTSGVQSFVTTNEQPQQHFQQNKAIQIIAEDEAKPEE